MSAFETQILPAACLIGLCAVIVYGMWSERQDIGQRARAKAMAEAADALQSLANVAALAAEGYRKAGIEAYAKLSSTRFYHYDRAASIVRSIPVDRL